MPTTGYTLEQRRVAVHEAAHCVAAVVLGVRLRAVAIDEGGGHVDFEPSDLLRSPLRNAEITAAGPMGALALLPEACQGRDLWQFEAKGNPPSDGQAILALLGSL